MEDVADEPVRETRDAIELSAFSFQLKKRRTQNARREHEAH